MRLLRNQRQLWLPKPLRGRQLPMRVACVYVAVIAVQVLRTVTALEIIPETFKSLTIGTNDSHEIVHAMAMDSLGNMYVAGTTSLRKGHPATFGEYVSGAVPVTIRVLDDDDRRESPQKREVLQLDKTDMFVAKINSTGDTEWIKRIGTSSMDTISSIVYRHGAVFVAGRTYGTFVDTEGNQPLKTSNLLVMKLLQDGTMSWTQPVELGSGGDDGVQALSFDQSQRSPYLFMCGYVGGSLFSHAKQTNATGSAVRFAHTVSRRQAWRASSTTGSGTERIGLGVRASRVGPGNEKANSSLRHLPAELEDISDMFVAKINPLDGKVEMGVQISLDRANSADAIVAYEGNVYVSVNSYSKARFDSDASTVLYIFRAEDLSYRAVHTPVSYNSRGAIAMSMSVGNTGHVYIGGFSLPHAEMSSGHFVVRKFNSKDSSYEWEKTLGQQTEVEPRLSLALSPVSGNLFVCGYSHGLFTQNDSQESLIRLPLTIFSPDGSEVMTWDRTAPYPLGYEEITSIALDHNENLMYAGKWLNPSTKVYDMLVGSFGAQSFTRRAASDTVAVQAALGSENKNGDGSSGSRSSSMPVGLGAMTVGLICVAAAVSLMVVVAALAVVRTKVFSRQLAFAPAEGYYDDQEEIFLSRFEESEMRKRSTQISGKHDHASRSFTNNVGSAGTTTGLYHASSNTGDGLKKRRNAPGGSAAPV